MRPCTGPDLGTRRRLGNLFIGAPLPYRISTIAVGVWLLLVILAGTLAIDAAANLASHLAVRQALAYL